MNSNSSTVLVTGGAGYIGSHVVKALLSKNYRVVVVDNLSNGHRDSVLTPHFYEGDIADSSIMNKVFSNFTFDAVMHFAGSIVVTESAEKPLFYYKNNTANSVAILDLVAKNKVPRMIFSSTAAVYGINENEKLSETSFKKPANPYAHSKLMTEIMIDDYAKINKNFKYVILRYFNVAGADPEGKIGQRGKSSTHLVKICSEVACGKRSELQIYGTDYNTKDGTCVRDYLHVSDLAQAHVAALSFLESQNKSDVFNCGYGKGYSVSEIADSFERVTGTALNRKSSARRAGDVDSLVCNNTKIQKHLDWHPKYANNLDEILKSAYNWEKRIMDDEPERI